MNTSIDEAFQITSLESIRDTPLRELYSDILHQVADPEGEGLAETVSLAKINFGIFSKNISKF